MGKPVLFVKDRFSGLFQVGAHDANPVFCWRRVPLVMPDVVVGNTCRIYVRLKVVLSSCVFFYLVPCSVRRGCWLLRFCYHGPILWTCQ